MPTLIVHLSDVHIAGPKDESVARAKPLVNAIITKVPRAESCYIVITGDIANSGDPTEYAVARDFMNEIKLGILGAGIQCVKSW